MFRTILVPLDGSVVAEAALPIAARLARSGPGRLRLILVHEPAPPLVGMGGPPVPMPAHEDALRAREKSYLAEAAARWGQASGAPVEYSSVEGRAGPEVCEEAGRLPADLVVMTTHGRGHFRRLWLGSVADYVVRHLTIPVLLLPHRALPEPADQERLGRLLVALDLSQPSEAVLEPVIVLPGLTGAELMLI
jgi:nucleotide-binding universal stress UspA family protein